MNQLSPQQLKSEFPLCLQTAASILSFREELKAHILQPQKKWIFIVGPCSVHDLPSSLEYADRLKKLSTQLNHIMLVMRVFFEKPRSYMGWKGLAYDPHHDESHDLVAGLRLSRELLCNIATLQVPIATEFVDPLIAPYFEDCISWGVIGARTSASQPHRQLASSFPFPVGFKNSVQGELDPALFGILSANLPHTYFGINQQGSLCIKKTNGNPYGHLVLRGSNTTVNFDPLSVKDASDALSEKGIQTRLLIDCSHGNSQKNPQLQKQAFISVIQQMQQGNASIAGCMLESHLFPGKQSYPKTPLDYGVSITDPCLGWEETASLLCWADEELAKSISSVQS